MQFRSFPVVADAGDDPKRQAFDDRSAVRPCAGLEYGFGLERRAIKPGEACRAAVRDKDFTLVRDGTGYARKSRQCCDVPPGVVVNHLDAVVRRVGDEDASALCIECGVVEGAVRSIRYLDDSKTLQGHGNLASLRRQERE